MEKRVLELQAHLSNKQEELKEYLLRNAEWGVDEDDEGNSSEIIENFYTEVHNWVVMETEDYLADVDMDEDFYEALVEQLCNWADDNLADYGEVFEILQDSAQAEREKWQDYYRSVM